MAGRKRAVSAPEEAHSLQEPVQFSKEQILTSAKFSSRRDLVCALLEANQKYTIETVEKQMEDFMKGKVK